MKTSNEIKQFIIERLEAKDPMSLYFEFFNQIKEENSVLGVKAIQSRWQCACREVSKEKGWKGIDETFPKSIFCWNAAINAINRGGRDEPDRLTIVGLWGRYILKPKSDTYPWLPEDEDLTMHLATLARIQVVPHALIRFSDGELTYITRRIDRDDDGRKYLMEDACQLSERLSADKYKSSYENVGKLILRYSSMPQLDLVNYWEVVVFSWLTGNSDMHLKNFSLFSRVPGLYTLAPAYDLLNVHLLFDDP